MDERRVKLNPVDLSYRDEHVEALMAENDKLIAEIERLRSLSDEPVAWQIRFLNRDEGWCECGEDTYNDVRQTGEFGMSRAEARALYTRSVPNGMQLVPEEILDRFPELNMSSYDHDDVAHLNNWGVELVLSASPKQEDGQ